jgi:hypothetical protein
MAQKSHYQILNVHPEADQATIEAAYRRLARIFSGQSDTTTAGMDTKMKAIEEAYMVLKNPILRYNYDMELQKQPTRPASHIRRLETSNHSNGVQAWLAYQHKAEGYVIFHIGWAADYSATIKALWTQIPAADRHYDEKRREWRIAETHGQVLKKLFSNYESPDDPPAVDLPMPIYPRRIPLHTSSTWYRTWMGWILAAVAMLAIAIAGNQILEQNHSRSLSDEIATAVARRGALEVEPGLDELPTLTPTPTPPVILYASPLYQNVHLRTGPGTEYDSLGYLYQEAEHALLGRNEDSSWVMVATGEQVGWSAAWTLEFEGELEQLSVYAADETPPPSLLLTLTPEATVTPETTPTP